ncbi:MAG TPA: hypothetical protein VFX70_13440 [Mycobacteriales bacterium]|nr:hypothetical protein [Mycobacteriales bacterium]
MTEPIPGQPTQPATPDTPSTPDTKPDPYAHRRDDWPAVIIDPDYAIPAPRR